MWGGWSTPRPGHFTPGKDPVPIVEDAGWASELVWTGAENFAHNRFRTSDRPACSESLYRLSYPGSSYLAYTSSELYDVKKLLSVLFLMKMHRASFLYSGAFKF